MKHKILMTLALLLTAVTGAWAEEKMVTINSSTMSSGAVTATGFNISDNYLYVNSNTATITTSEGVITKLVIKKYNGSYGDNFTEANVGVTPGTITYGTDEITVTDINAESVTLSRKGGDNWSTSSVDVYYGAPTTFPFPITWDAATKTGTFTMPAYDVEIAPIYAPTAQWATDGEPTAIEGIIAGEAKDIVKAGTVATTKIGEADPIAQGTVMYAVTTENKQPTSTTGFSATVPTGAALTDSYTENQTVYVWYYIKGIDAAEGVTPTAENTFNDSEICETPLTVKLKANQFTLTLDPAPVKNITVTAGTETKTPTTEGKTDIKMNSEVKLKANEGYKIKKVVIKKDPVAEGHALTSAKFGEIVCSDGKAYAAADKDILPKGVKAEALVCYANGDHGLALAMADVKNAKMSWDNNRGANDGKTAAEWCDGWNTSHPIAGATWLLASQTQWDNMISAAGGASNLSNAFSAVGGTNLQAWSYWSSTPEHSGSAAYMYYFPSSSWQWTYLTQDNTGNYIRACLEW